MEDLSHEDIFTLLQAIDPFITSGDFYGEAEGGGGVYTLKVPIFHDINPN